MTREVIVLAHELSQGNYKRFGGSLLVLAEYSKTATAALSALVGPIGVVVAAIGAIGLAMAEGAHEQDAFNKSLILTGNYAGMTADSFNATAKQIATDTHTTIGAAREGTAGARHQRRLRPRPDQARRRRRAAAGEDHGPERRRDREGLRAHARRGRGLGGQAQ